MTELVKLGNWLSAIQARKKEMVKTLLQGSHRVNLTTKGRHPFTLFSSVDESGDMRNLIFNYAGLGPVYRKKCK
jgi:hypothetical protein